MGNFMVVQIIQSVNLLIIANYKILYSKTQRHVTRPYTPTQ